LHQDRAFPQIETQRLLLRPWREADREPWAAMNADPRVRQFFPGLLDRERSDASIDLFMERLARDGFTFWAMEEKATGAFVGFTGLSRVDFEAPFTPCVEVGWRLAHAFWKRGLASEAALASLDFGFDRQHLPEIVAFTTSRNLRSRRVMERIGMRRDPHGDFIHPKMPPDHPLQPSVLYRITPSDHARSQQSRSVEEPRS
jgi:RimJ/RimL family protein N-acetyltransferase